MASNAPTVSTVDESGENPKIFRAGSHPRINASDYVHAAVEGDPTTGAILTPIVQCATYVQESVEKYLEKGFSYSRCANPTVRVLEKKIGILEGSSDACAFNTGMAATISVLCAVLRSGDHCVMTQCSYGGTNRAARVMFQKMYGVEFSFVDFTDLAAVEAAIIPGRTKMIFSETPCNPVLELADVPEISKIAEKYSGKSGTPYSEILLEGEGPSREALHDKILHVCDSTLATPYILRPLDHGADITIQSLTKFYDGHNMTVGGAVICRDLGLLEVIRFHQNVLGSIMTPQIAYYVLQTTKTLPLRVRHQSESAMAIAKFLQEHPKVQSVTYPGLPSHKQYEIAEKLHTNGLHGGMLCFEVRGGSEAGRKLMNSVPYPWTLAENLGAAESIITCPSVFTHANMRKEDRDKVGITDGLVRVSVGIEDTTDLIRALGKALDML